MRTIYLRNVKVEDAVFYFPWFWKVTEHKDKVTVLEVTKDEINVKNEEDFFEEVHFIKNRLTFGSGGSKEISREEFDEFFKKTVELMNNASKL